MRYSVNYFYETQLVKFFFQLPEKRSVASLPRYLEKQPHAVDFIWTPTMLWKNIYTEMRLFANFFCETNSVKFLFSNFQTNVVFQTLPRGFKKQPHAVEFIWTPTMLWKTIHTVTRYSVNYFCETQLVNFFFFFQTNVVF